jgi:hypothetical protein
LAAFKFNLYRYNPDVMRMQRDMMGPGQGQGQHPGSGGDANGHHMGGGSTVPVHNGAYSTGGPDPAPEGRDAETLDMLTLWAKLDGFSPSDFPAQGLALEVHRWLRQKILGAVSGHIQPGCTLLTVDCMLSLADSSQIRTDGVQALADALLAGPLGARGDVTVGMGPEALVCVADRDVAGNVIPGRFSRRIPLNAAGLMPGGAEAVRACAASLRANQTQMQASKPEPQFLKVSPSCVFSGGAGQSELEARGAGACLGDETYADGAAKMSTVCVTFPAAALPGCALRCRANGRTVPISILSAFRAENEAMTLVVNMEATGVDGVAMLELVRSSHGVDVLGNHSAQHAETDQHAALSGVPAGLPAMPVLLISDREVYDSMAEILVLKYNAQSSFGQHASTLYSLGATMRGKASAQQAFQSACWAASKGKMGRALTARLLELYPATSLLTSPEDAAQMLLHAAASGDMETVLTVMYHCRVAAEARGFLLCELAIFPVGAGGETALHRAAALHERGGDADVMYELLATLEKPLSWTMASPRRPKLTGTTLLVEGVGAATATLVRVARRYPRSASEAGTLTADEIVQEAISASPVPAELAPRESARAAITMELLSTPVSAAWLLNVAARFNADDNGGGAAAAAAAADAASGAAALGLPTLTHDDPLSSSHFVAAACERWPTLGAGLTLGARALDFIHSVRVGARNAKSWIVSHGPNGDGNIVFATDPKRERAYLHHRSKTQYTIDYMVGAVKVVNPFFTLSLKAPGFNP